ncbi:MAG TPA: 2-phospho-L-lactate guanylyltransferase [Methanotrichaceae archaeon]|nr:MAG: 2-phospho-L-lactate guanylyltransferase [Methanosaeta sp. PtaU1.Bin028]HOT06900.1 2-phospho-L-lactate guanylyltransferase [Methanotrichaceae archaeon]HQF16478.1 2-phospho-L-lactate guanylyltransferase [Methanotrichaceae archaeon]HQI91901.1 2-phospho-L-lactate guanylyltransferase [Methanotrichaceae archaeon]HQJ28458.1 2-phospho-L-lactate guanylyltransferase [Methanotrichaceae archaeon]
MSRPLWIVIPFKFSDCKSRLADCLSPSERMGLAMAMLQDVLEAVAGRGRITIISRPGFLAQGWGGGAEVRISDLDLNEALNEMIGEQAKGWAEDMLIVMADLALLQPEDIDAISAIPGDVVLAPGRGGGTNMILMRSPAFRTCYRGISFPKHQKMALDLGLTAGYFYSYRAGCDIDEPSDLVELVLHGRGRSACLAREMKLVDIQ